MKSDIQIAQEAKMIHIRDVASQLGITEDDLDLYGKYKAKLSDELLSKLDSRPDGKLVLVTAINPTPAGEGKTTTSVGLGQAMGVLGKKACLGIICSPGNSNHILHLLISLNLICNIKPDKKIPVTAI